MTLLPLASLLALVGCFEQELPDTDGDGINDLKEESLGLDPNNADTDGDGLEDAVEVRETLTDPLNPDTDEDRLNDGDELDLGTDPFEPDTDNDTYLDGWEVAEGTDPLDEDSRIYQGYWSYNPDKDDYKRSDSFERPKVGKALYDMRMVDQFGDEVSMYDLAGQGKPILMDISAEWCGPCHYMAMWLAGGDYSQYSEWPSWMNFLNGSWSSVPEKIAAGDIIWVTVLSQDRNGNPPDAGLIASWESSYPNENIPLLLDAEMDWMYCYSSYGLPSVFMFDENLETIAVPSGSKGYGGVLDLAEAYEAP